MHVEQTEIPDKLRQMVDMLVDEEARQEDNTTGVCMEYFLKNGVLQYLVNVSEKADYPVGIRGESIRTIASMVDLLDDRFLVHNAVHKPTVKLLRFCVLDERQSELYHEDLVDLMYIICSKIHGFPALLNVFFHDKQWLTTPQKPHRISQLHPQQQQPPPPQTQQPPSTETSPEYEFLLFTYLLRFVHREGRSGDFARTGLLFLMEMATNQLGDFILESDFATIMAAGLGALYSQLPRKLVIKDEGELSASSAAYLLGQDLDQRTMPSGMGVEVSSSPEFRYQLDSFLKLLEFCQDVLIRCPNVNISVALLQNIRTIFLSNILYPSILECSDIDGSSVAVISYIDLILQTLQQDELSDVVVGFLMDEDSPAASASTAPEDATMEANIFAGVELDRFKSSPYFTAAERFTLRDLIFSRLKSSSQPTVIATLKLLKTLISKHYRYSLKLLSVEFQEEPLVPLVKKSGTIISHHIREIELYFSLISAIDQVHADDILATGYEAYLRDMEALIDSEWGYPPTLHTEGLRSGTRRQHAPKSERRRSFKYGRRLDEHKGRIPSHIQSKPRTEQTYKHYIKPTDPLLQILLGLLSHFFAQSSELNLALTSVISSLALCPYRSLEGWITFRESDRTNPDDILVLDSESGNPIQQLQIGRENEIRSQDIYAHFDTSQVDEDDDDDDRSIDYGVERNSAHMTVPTQFKSFPPFFTLFRTLTQQIDYYRSEVEGFDALLEERWQGLIFGELETPPSSLTTPSLSTSTRRGSLHPVKNDPVMNAAVQSSSMSLFGGGQSRRPSILRPSSSPSVPPYPTVPKPNGLPPNPSKSLSSTTTAAAMAAAGSVMTPATTPLPNTNHIVNNPLSPFAVHARRTQDIRIQPLFPSSFVTDPEEPILDLDAEDEDTFAPKAANPSQARRMDKSTEITLSMLLNNVVILEECIKELVAIMQVRRSLGIDEIRYT
ncbi:Retinoic acid induced 16-like protein-domain-containing protein [Radiomyces spectabilis]|uniref:Retinoic acid induced 16-like protein-domain-containing protein n=1 Tax=Radiomyces spectabilis TaxID=64574 RepID=UPI0022206319|nr:Retinoic acid induced 16-like protein-domain-containing protein [Radiomyces spectabilis]KAI8376052.1 Retinoic acid induced 16-like protein-domain-containing protein [Radiomyces spectabilis]